VVIRKQKCMQRKAGNFNIMLRDAQTEKGSALGATNNKEKFINFD